MSRWSWPFACACTRRGKKLIFFWKYQSWFTDKTAEGLAHSLPRQRCDLGLLPQVPIKVDSGKKALEIYRICMCMWWSLQCTFKHVHPPRKKKKIMIPAHTFFSFSVHIHLPHSNFCSMAHMIKILQPLLYMVSLLWNCLFVYLSKLFCKMQTLSCDTEFPFTYKLNFDKSF